MSGDQETGWGGGGGRNKADQLPGVIRDSLGGHVPIPRRGGVGGARPVLDRPPGRQQLGKETTHPR